jgi:uroporphyrinogen decarboxylase
MCEGGSSKTFRYTKELMYRHPEALHLLLDKLADSVIDYLNAQVANGAQSLMIFDTWGGVLTPRDYKAFSLFYMTKIVAGLNRENEGRKVPVTLFTKNGGQWLDQMARSGCDALGVDWTTDLETARTLVDGQVALQGNMDPSMLYGTPERIREEVKRILKSYGKGSGHVFNLGHGIHPDIDPENVRVFIDSVAEFSAQYHQGC